MGIDREILEWPVSFVVSPFFFLFSLLFFRGIQFARRANRGAKIKILD